MDAKEKKEFICEMTQVKESTSIERTFPIGKRHIQVAILLMCTCIIFGIRAHLSVVLVAMTDTHKNAMMEKSLNENVSDMQHKCPATLHDQEEPLDKNNAKFSLNYTTQRVTLISPICNDTVEGYNNITKFNETTTNSVFRTYDWTKDTQEIISGAMFVGYFVMNIPMGMVSQRFGGKVPLLLALFVNSVVSIIIPWAASMGGWLPVCICRLLQGMTQAGLFPAIHTILGQWVPLSERGRLSAYTYTGAQLGIVLGYQCGGYASGILGWPVTFWICGGLGLICFVVLYVVGAATPAEHPTITEAEKQFIVGNKDQETSHARRKVPWRAIITSAPVWAVILPQAANGYCNIICFTQMPAYMSKILRVDIKNNGLLSSIPFITMWLVGLGMGHASDFLLNRGYMTLINIRRAANTLGMAVAGGLLVSFAYAHTLPMAAVLLVLTFGAHSAVHVGFAINHLDLSPNFAGTVMSIGTVGASLSGVLASTTVGLIVKDQTNQSQWQMVFLITASVMLVANMIFVIFLKADVQPWNDYNINTDDCKYDKISKVYFSSNENELNVKKEKESNI